MFNVTPSPYCDIAGQYIDLFFEPENKIVKWKVWRKCFKSNTWQAEYKDESGQYWQMLVDKDTIIQYYKSKNDVPVTVKDIQELQAELKDMLPHSDCYKVINGMKVFRLWDTPRTRERRWRIENDKKHRLDIYKMFKLFGYKN